MAKSNKDKASLEGVQLPKEEPKKNIEPEATPVAPAPAKKRLTLADVSLNELVEVVSCLYGKLIYVSSKTGYEIVWPEHGTVQYITVDELMTMRNSQPSFFKNGWVKLSGENAANVINFLQLERFYNEASFTDHDQLLTMDIEEVSAKLSGLDNDKKENIARFLYSKIKNGELDSRKRIEAFEDALGYQLKE